MKQVEESIAIRLFCMFVFEEYGLISFACMNPWIRETFLVRTRF